MPSNGRPQYLICLHGIGDNCYMLVGQAAWDWIKSPRPDFGRGTSIMEPVPEAVRIESNGKLPPAAFVTIGSCENDRALFLQEGYECLDEHPKTLTVEGTWVGASY